MTDRPFQLFESELTFDHRSATIPDPKQLRDAGLRAWAEIAIPIHAELVELAKLCGFNARAAAEERAALELWKMAKEYQEKAAKLDSGKLPDIGSSSALPEQKETPSTLKCSSAQGALRWLDQKPRCFPCRSAPAEQPLGLCRTSFWKALACRHCSVRLCVPRLHWSQLPPPTRAP